MGLGCGIVGLPNVGKSTLFNALTSSQRARADNYPFCTIDPNKGQVPVPDPRLMEIAKRIQPEKVQPNFLEFVDIAGLVKGASKGEGLGNQFLSHIRETHSLLHVIRAFEDKQITSPHEVANPQRDKEIIDTELVLADLETAEKRLKKIEKFIRIAGDKELKEEMSALKKSVENLTQGIPLRRVSYTSTEKPLIYKLCFITLKPVLHIVNHSEEDYSKEKPEEVYFRGEKEETLSLSCALEAEISRLKDPEKTQFLRDIGLKEPVLNRVIKKAYQQLGLITFFTAGEKEVRAWTLPRGETAPRAGGVIHSDFEKGFIRAEVYSCESLFQHSSEKELRQKGLIRTEGKNYIVRDGDVLHFRFHTPKGAR